ncbi:sugar ABC transporter ATP-binding protein [Paenibacillus validus]|uniref:Ribose/galactose/methyl galactoside import ATP-binding protein n=1 Tax=Paenibacillus validus TaxID=44253 RepID=A0A7X2Z9T0_9BACL|nr:MULTISPECIES: sugar ABC transporter ATP-binding protein [Paenibacillus]MED4599351.1 sugar ABC transporter ATP-binding protein [Paenibacillus validus]MED4606337.1 sugar ABC transporter ATP-binding protein [Paenibacillus validus]MUG70141.1 ATP-binding cassette domain-containing protein [Paenibacillus validus]
MANDYILELEHITKTFPGVKALDDIQLKVRKGTVHALMGENGAGKSTLMKIIFGIYTPDQGTVKFKGQEIKLSGSKDALSRGISMIHQELSPIPQMTVAENIYLGRETTTGFGWLDKKKMVEDTRKLFETLKIDIDPNAKMIDLSIANTQMVEIATAVSYNADLIIMDEPTSAITDKEVEQLFAIIGSLKAKGVSIIYISHKMDEIFRICDDITVFRDGQYVGTKAAKELDQESLIQMMVGREIKQVFHKEDADIGEVVLSVKNLSREGKFNNISFDVRKGEILGIAGLMGAGRTEVIESIFGIHPPDAGEIYINGVKVSIRSPRDAIKHKIGLLTEDRKITGAFLPISIRDNMIISSIDSYLNRGGFIKRKLVTDMCNLFVERLSIKTPSLDQLIMNLSGGNQQKVLLARWLLNNPDILILDEPTRGIDVGAKSEIHKLMSRLAQTGKAIIMISSELPEVLGMSDRVVVMHEGRKKGELSRAEANQEKIMELAYS